MFYDREKMLKLIRGYTNRSFIAKNKKNIRVARIMRDNEIAIYRNLKKKKLNKEFENNKLYWRKKMRNRKFFLKFYKTYIRSKNRYIYDVLSKYKHYIITFKSFYSNFYIMLTDNFGNPIVSCSTGQVSNSRSKKRKNSMMLLYPMIKKIKIALNKRRARHIAIHIRMDISSKIITAIKFLNYSKMKYNVSYIALLNPIPHHFGRKKRKPRRI